ncbi:hypothetical protein [Actinoplanes sp. NPDC049599]|uniref:hypothetical protein n=1 Tax=Actinoplanes sp. NPDC049599 TaxID=3363903 RepID=UPI00379E230A
MLHRFGGLTKDLDLTDQVDDEVRAGLERLDGGSQDDRATALFLAAALRTGSLSRITLSVDGGADDADIYGDTLLIREALRGDPDRLDTALRNAVAAHGTALFERATVKGAVAESGDWQCALTCLACSLFDVGCEACQACSDIPPHV